jgi:hypothetical protein
VEVGRIATVSEKNMLPPSSKIANVIFKSEIMQNLHKRLNNLGPYIGLGRPMSSTQDRVVITTVNHEANSNS